MYKPPQQRSQSRIPTTTPKANHNQQATDSFRVQPQLENSQTPLETQKYSPELANLLAAKMTSTTRQPAAQVLPIQTKLTVGAPGDKYEQEADSMASRVMSISDSAVQRQRALGTQIQPQVQARFVQRAPDRSVPAGGNIENQLQSSQGGGSPLSGQIRAYMEPRFGADFSSVRVHTGEQAVQMNRELGAQAFTHGSNIYYGAGKSPGVNELTAHELTHVVQQMDGLQRKCTNCEKEDEQIMRKEDDSLSSLLSINSQVGDNMQRIGGEGYRLTIAPIDLQSEPQNLEHEADKMTEQVMRSDHKLLHSPLSKNITKNKLSTPAIQRARIPLPRPIPLCGLNLTHIDVEPPRARDLEPCQPKNVRVTRVNVIGRQVTAATTGNGRIVFNLHIGYYRDPATGRLCAIVDDSKQCIAPRCKELGCFPTIQEVMQAIISFLIGALIVLGTIALTIIEAIIKELFGGSVPIPEPI